MNRIQTHKFINWAVYTILAVSVCFMPQTAMAAESSELHEAAEAGDVAKINRLIKAGANVNAVDKNGWTPLHLAAGEGHADAAIVLIEAGADVNAVGDKYGITPLHGAALQGHTDAVIALLEAGADVNAVDKDGLTPLHLAAFLAALNDHTDAIVALLEAGANVNAADKDGDTPLHEAAYGVHTDAIVALLEAGADVNAMGESGWTPLHSAAYRGHTDAVIALLEAGADVNAVTKKDGWTSLHDAAYIGHADAVIALIEAGAYTNATDNDGNTPLALAKNNKKWSVAAILENPPSVKRRRQTEPPQGEAAPNVAIAEAPDAAGVAEQVFENAWRSVVFIRTNDGQGGGVIIRPNIVATNCHVIDGGGIEVYKAANRNVSDTHAYRATVRRRDDDRDFCLLDVKGLWGVPANVRKYDTLRVGENVYGIGAPKGLDLSLSGGIISQLRKNKNRRVIQTDTAISPGSSGGGLFDREGNLIGIMTEKFVADDVEGIGFAIPADLALE